MNGSRMTGACFAYASSWNARAYPFEPFCPSGAERKKLSAAQTMRSFVVLSGAERFSPVFVLCALRFFRLHWNVRKKTVFGRFELTSDQPATGSGRFGSNLWRRHTPGKGAYLCRVYSCRLHSAENARMGMNGTKRGRDGNPTGTREFFRFRRGFPFPCRCG